MQKKSANLYAWMFLGQKVSLTQKNIQQSVMTF